MPFRFMCNDKRVYFPAAANLIAQQAHTQVTNEAATAYGAVEERL